MLLVLIIDIFSKIEEKADRKDRRRYLTAIREAKCLQKRQL
jgi:hypothetical protein